MRRVIWTEPAREDVVGIRDYIEQFRPLAARTMADRLYAAAEALSQNPERGQIVGKGRRELIVARPYRIIYRVTEDAVFILRVRHAARRPA